MNTPKIPHSGVPNNKKTVALSLQYATMALLALAGCSDKKESTESEPSISQTLPGAPIDTYFFSDMMDRDFDTGVRTKIGAIALEVPEIMKLFTALEASLNSRIHFLNKEEFHTFLLGQKMPPDAIDAYIRDLGAATHLPDKTSPTDTQHVYIYLSPYALSHKERFIEGVSNELLNTYTALNFPEGLEKKQRSPDATGGLNISPSEMRGIGIEFTKEYISGLTSTLIREKYEQKDITCSVSQLRENLKKGIFWKTDTPGYAIDYFYQILRSHGFPVEKDAELVKLYHFCIDTHWPNIASNTLKMCEWLELPVQKK